MPIFYARQVRMQSERRHPDGTEVTHKFIHKNCELFLRSRQNRFISMLKKSAQDARASFRRKPESTIPLIYLALPAGHRPGLTHMPGRASPV